ncbi:MAG: bifunctional adenosylcobinamide kinase/adenosylcobinamide-phosphate guanylyltransferase [Syntrophaceae bacterium]|nr:bifunctional adenosylcobinamide kinase/adenosylcobinamide-phosphate guanylyltransferase [Syntrophaceae bacterium]
MEIDRSLPHPGASKKRIIFITGGARSGKSRFAEELARQFSGPKAYLATAQALDEEMAERIRRHRETRSGDWQTLEEPMDVTGCVEDQGDRFHLILLDCLTLWVSNLMMAGWDGAKILEEGDRLLGACRQAKCSLILVGNEVGMGIVPENAQARLFRDLSGFIQQNAARQSDEVYFMVSGLPVKIKGA